MKKLPPIVSAEPVFHGARRLAFTDGHEGMADLGRVIAGGGIIARLQKPENFQKVRLEEHRHHDSWLDEGGIESDPGAGGLRRDAERRAEFDKLIAS